MKIKFMKNEKALFQLIVFESVSSIVLICVSGCLLWLLFIGQKNLIDAGKLRYQSYLLADQLRQSSDDLTRMVRTYAATGNPKFEQQFRDVLAIRDGYKPRPVHYERVYWDFLAVEEPTAPFKDGEKIALEELMRRAGFSDREFELLGIAKRRSDRLVELEDTAMNAMKGIFEDANGEFTSRGEPDPQKALRILFGEEYHQAKKGIMEPINAFLESIDNRTQENIDRRNSQVKLYLVLLIASFGMLITTGFSLLMTIAFYHRLMMGKLRVAIDDKTQELLETNKELQQAVEAAEAASRAKSAFLSSVSHELRTPLNAILGFCRITSRSRNLPQEDKENLGIIRRSGEHLLNLINDVLDMSKIEAGYTTTNEKDFDLHRMLDELEDMVRLRSEEKGLELVFEHLPDVPQYIRTDELKLRQTLINLLNNAVKFTETGGIQLSVNCGQLSQQSEERIADHRLLFSVKDTGHGIPPEELDSVFETFVQSRSGRLSWEGTGLGLPISRRFVQLMGGDMTVSSEPGVGTTFNFDIRVRRAESADVQRSYPDRRIVGLEPGQPRYRLLIVDDRRENRQLLLKLLQPLGFELREAEDGKQAIEIWDQWSPHLIWMDMRMPVMDGYEATMKIKESTKGLATAVIALTASAYEEERSVILSVGCDDFVRKPFRENDIFNVMAKHLGIRYIYEDTPADELQRSDDAYDPKPDDLSVMSDEWCTAFHEASIAGDAEKCLELIGQIPSDHSGLARRLDQLVQEFAFDKLVMLTRNPEENDDFPE